MAKSVFSVKIYLFKSTLRIKIGCRVKKIQPFLVFRRKKERKKERRKERKKERKNIGERCVIR